MVWLFGSTEARSRSLSTISSGSIPIYILFFICLPFWLPRLNASEMENRDWRRAIFLSFWFLIRSLFSGTGLLFLFLRNPFSSAPFRIELNLSLLLLLAPAELIWNQLGSHAWVETQSSFPDLLDQKSTSIKMGQWTVTRQAGPLYISDIWLRGAPLDLFSSHEAPFFFKRADWVNKILHFQRKMEHAMQSQ